MADEVPNSGDVSDDEMAAAYSVPAYLSNRFVVTVTANGIRLAFGEQALPDRLANFRTAVTMSLDEAIQLRELLKKMLTPYEDFVRSREEASKNANG